MKDFLPLSRTEMALRGWTELDFLLVTGDSYVDHPSFGAAVIGRILEAAGFKVGILAQPDWREAAAFTVLGRPRLAALVTAGNLDSMVSNYTAAKKHRRTDVYAPGGLGGRRPDRAIIVYANRLREVFRDLPLIIGGVEASLRRLAHYDYWEDTVRRSLLVDARADLVVYGMGELQIKAIAARLHNGEVPDRMRDIPGTAFLTGVGEGQENWLHLPSFEEVSTDKTKYNEAYRLLSLEQNPFSGRILAQPHGNRLVVVNPPARPLSVPEMDEIYGLPYQRTYHPAYTAAGGVPALQEVEFSITSHRGCFGSCSFCAIHFHQGCIIQHRSRESIITEAKALTRQKNFKGIIHDIGGPTANFCRPACAGQSRRGGCRDRQCLYPEPCPSLKVDHAQFLDTLRAVRSLPGVRQVFVRSGLRYDYLMADRSDKFLEELCRYHVSGQLKVAPEHVSSRVTNLMRKPGRKVFEAFAAKYRQVNNRLGKKQYLVPYLISGHPGSGLREAVEMAEFVRDLGYNPEQVQDFTPTPGSLSTCIYFTGVNPLTDEKVWVPRSDRERALQRALLQYRDPKNYPLVHEALVQAGRTDLIGFGPRCLIRPNPPGKGVKQEKNPLVKENKLSKNLPGQVKLKNKGRKRKG